MEEEYQDTVRYRNASVCPAGQTSGNAMDDCVEQVTAQVIDKKEGRSCTADANGNVSCTIPTYDLKVRHLRGPESLTVRERTYRDVNVGDPVVLRFWDGAVARMEAGGHTETYYSHPKFQFAWALAVVWMVSGAVLAALAIAAGSSLGYFLLAWLLLAPAATAIAFELLSGPLKFGHWLIAVPLGGGGLWFLIFAWLERSEPDWSEVRRQY
ncbi:hypothetical protein [Streptomyces sp. NPDC101166]|uniref:hypothetical protein n=1 Tax=Streptomyces sp. NPDC101166 TaxID=3366120 RepID=UPI0038151FD3